MKIKFSDTSNENLFMDYLNTQMIEQFELYKKNKETKYFQFCGQDVFITNIEYLNDKIHEVILQSRN